MARLLHCAKVMRALAFDAIVIGSGIGGLTVAAILAKLNQKKVVVLEKHFTAGGLTHEFARGRYRWDVGLHYVGEVEPGHLARSVFDYITDGKLQWTKMPRVFERFVYPDETIDEPDDPEDYRTRLNEEFPAERNSISKYFHDIRSAAAWSKRYLAAKGAPAPISWLTRLPDFARNGFANVTVKEYLDARFSDDRLKGVLASQWGDYGLPPSSASFAVHALIVNSYLHGGFYPVGGAGIIARRVQPVIERSGGAILLDQHVTGLIVEHDVVKGVQVTCPGERGEQEVEYRAPIVISDIGIMETHEKFSKAFDAGRDDDLHQIPSGLSAITAYVGLKGNPQSLGVKGENYWIYDSYDHDDIVARS